MTTWRMKRMPLKEWSALQENFAALQMAQAGDPRLAMFVSGEPGATEQDIYITGPDLPAIERFSPGGWEDSAAPHGPHVSLLVGTADARERFEIDRERR